MTPREMVKQYFTTEFTTAAEIRTSFLFQDVAAGLLDVLPDGDQKDLLFELLLDVRDLAVDLAGREGRAAAERAAAERPTERP